MAAVMNDLYDAELNPGGAIPMCVAESRGQFHPSFSSKLLEVREGCIEGATGQYANMCGRDRFRAAVAACMSRTILRGRMSLDPACVVVSAGCGALLLQLSLLLLDEGDVVLLPTPTYPALYNDIQTLAAGRVVDMPMAADGYRFTRAALESAAERAGGRARVLLLLNPSNPLGVVHSVDELQLAVGWARERGMHVIVDEIYALSVHAPVVTDEPDDLAAGVRGRSAFRSVVEILAEYGGLGSDVHVLWGMSKDWAASGLRVGFLYTQNAELLTALSNVNYFTSVSNDTQDSLAGVLEDASWCDAYLDGCRAHLSAAAAAVQEELAAAAAVGVRIVLAPQAGMFAFLDLRALLRPAPGEAAGEWAAEERLTADLLAHARLLFTPGSACHAAEPGFYRCCFAWMPTPAVREGFRRLRKFAEQRQAGEV